MSGVGALAERDVPKWSATVWWRERSDTLRGRPPVVRGPAASLPRWWLREALCIHRHESVNWHRTTDWLGQPSVDHGGMQINVGTWAEMAPRGYPREPAAASPSQQLVVAHRIWVANDDRFGGNQWYLSAAACGVP